jgi:hypothetical protein
MKFVLTRSLFQDAFGKKVSKNLKIVWNHATLPKTGWSPLGTVGPLGVNISKTFSRVKKQQDLRATLYYSGEGHQSRILGKFWNMIGQKWDSCPVEVYTMVKNPPVENFAHGWRSDMAANVATLFWRGVLRRSSFLGNLKASDKKLGLRRTLTWIKYYPSMWCFQHFKVIIEGLGLVSRIFTCSNA